jgi:uncharacterized membrane protein
MEQWNKRMDEPKETGRIESFSDGVFAVAITLLVLNLQLPANAKNDILLDNSHLLSWFIANLPIFLAFVTSFATIGVMWINHHRVFTHIKRSNATLMLLNLLLLLVVVFIPFPTALLAEAFTTPTQRFAGVFYNGTYLVLTIVFNIFWRYVSHKNRLFGRQVNMHEVQAISNQYRFGPLVYLTVFGVGWINVPASVILNLLLAIYFALPPRKPLSSTQAASSAESITDETDTVEASER